MIYGIVGVAKNGIIGNNGSIPWKYPEDMKFFKERTINSVIVMGRKTYDSLGKPLPKRLNLVLTNNSIINHEVLKIKDRSVVLNYANHIDIYIIGGNSVWDMFMGDIETWLITRIPEEPQGDTLFDEKKYLKRFEMAEDIKLNTLTVNTYVRKPQA